MVIKHLGINIHRNLKIGIRGIIIPKIELFGQIRANLLNFSANPWYITNKGI